jgi:hypothetical protein
LSTLAGELAVASPARARLHPGLAGGGVMLAVLVGAALLVPVLSPYGPNA